MDVNKALGRGLTEFHKLRPNHIRLWTSQTTATHHNSEHSIQEWLKTANRVNSRIIEQGISSTHDAQESRSRMPKLAFALWSQNSKTSSTYWDYFRRVWRRQNATLQSLTHSLSINTGRSHETFVEKSAYKGLSNLWYKSCL